MSHASDIRMQVLKSVLIYLNGDTFAARGAGAQTLVCLDERLIDAVT